MAVEATKRTVETAAGEEGGGRLAVVVDTDIGDDIDDTWALSYLLSATDRQDRIPARAP